MGYLSTKGVTVWTPSKKKKSPRKYKQRLTAADKLKASKFKRDDWDPGFGAAETDTELIDAAWRLDCPNQNYKLLRWVKITSVSSEKATRLPTHPLETGMVKHDHKIIEPRKINVSCYIEAEDDMSRSCSSIFNDLVESKSLDDYITVISPMEEFPEKMYLVSYRDTTERDKTDVFTFTLTLQELLLATNKDIVASNPDYSGTSSKGGQGPGTQA